MYYGKPQQVNTTTETSYMDPITGQWITETTTTTTDNYGYNNGYNNNYNNNTRYNDRDRDGRYNPPPPPVTPSEMDGRAFNDAKQSISSASFDDTKLSTAKTIIGSNFMSTAQVMDICRLFSFDSNKLTFAKFAYSHVTDPQNYFKVASVFDFDSNKRALNDFISRGGR
jgi:hypothetical protein